jgi:hypothetical protein
MVASRKLDADSVVASVASYFDANSDADGFITATNLRDLIEQVTGRDVLAKTVRGRLRAIKARDQKQFKNATWRIDATLAVGEVMHYARHLIEQDAS